jgi:hypothetical protein
MTNWFPFFSMLLWCAMKLTGLYAASAGLMLVWGCFAAEFRFMGFVWALLTLGLGAILLCTEIVFDLATNEMRQRSSVAK